MVYSETIAKRVRRAIGSQHDVVEKKMFGGVGFMLNGNLWIGVWQDFLIVRVGLDAYRLALQQPHTREFDITGKPLRGWIMVEPEGFATSSKLKFWLEMAFEFVDGLPHK